MSAADVRRVSQRHSRKVDTLAVQAAGNLQGAKGAVGHLRARLVGDTVVRGHSAPFRRHVNDHGLVQGVENHY